MFAGAAFENCGYAASSRPRTISIEGCRRVASTLRSSPVTAAAERSQEDRFMDLEVQCQRAEAFRRMHDRSRILVLPNARDAMSARIFETAGFTAIATTSAGVSYSIGYPDGELVPRRDDRGSRTHRAL